MINDKSNRSVCFKFEYLNHFNLQINEVKIIRKRNEMIKLNFAIMLTHHKGGNYYNVCCLFYYSVICTYVHSSIT